MDKPQTTRKGQDKTALQCPPANTAKFLSLTWLPCYCKPHTVFTVYNLTILFLIINETMPKLLKKYADIHLILGKNQNNIL